MHFTLKFKVAILTRRLCRTIIMKLSMSFRILLYRFYYDAKILLFRSKVSCTTKPKSWESRKFGWLRTCPNLARHQQNLHQIFRNIVKNINFPNFVLESKRLKKNQKEKTQKNQKIKKTKIKKTKIKSKLKKIRIKNTKFKNTQIQKIKNTKNQKMKRQKSKSQNQKSARQKSKNQKYKNSKYQKDKMKRLH